MIISNLYPDPTGSVSLRLRDTELYRVLKTFTVAVRNNRKKVVE
jgi:hypothetical protein